MNKLKPMLEHLMDNEAAVSTIEYALLASLIAAFCMLGASILGTAVNDLFVTICKTYPGTSSC